MPYSLSWFIEGRVLFNRFYGELTIDDVRSTIQETVRLAQSGQPPVHQILISKEVTRLPFDLKALTSVVPRQKEPNIGVFVQVSTNTIYNFFTTIATHISAVDFRTARSVEEAFGQLQHLDASLKQFTPDFSTFNV